MCLNSYYILKDVFLNITGGWIFSNFLRWLAREDRRRVATLRRMSPLRQRSKFQLIISESSKLQKFMSNPIN